MRIISVVCAFLFAVSASIGEEPSQANASMDIGGVKITIGQSVDEVIDAWKQKQIQVLPSPKVPEIPDSRQMPGYFAKRRDQVLGDVNYTNGKIVRMSKQCDSLEVALTYLPHDPNERINVNLADVYTLYERDKNGNRSVSLLAFRFPSGLGVSASSIGGKWQVSIDNEQPPFADNSDIPCATFTNGNRFLDFGEQGQGIYVAGLTDGFLLSNILAIKLASLKWVGNCVEGKSIFQLNAMFEKYMKEHPERWDKPASTLYLEALNEMCPNSPKNQKPGK